MSELDDNLAAMMEDAGEDAGEDAEEGFYDLVIAAVLDAKTKAEAYDFCRRNLGYVPQEVQAFYLYSK